MPEPRQLVLISQARRDLEQARTLGEVKEVRDKAEAIRHYVRAQGESLEVQNCAAEVRLRAERRAGELLAEMEKNKGTRLGGCTVQPPDPAPTLADLGIEKTQSHR